MEQPSIPYILRPILMVTGRDVYARATPDLKVSFSRQKDCEEHGFQSCIRDSMVVFFRQLCLRGVIFDGLVGGSSLIFYFSARSTPPLAPNSRLQVYSLAPTEAQLATHIPHESKFYRRSTSEARSVPQSTPGDRGCPQVGFFC
eukprot:1382652-Amorphochlora_amoeboformis.AAC.3